jgi:CMP-N,N'-diacetyllegionaminic acid synthase|tara:strand:+ start:291 stop:992 length:702 start_codon:yes stop_codon:yes gene_type:complete
MSYKGYNILAVIPARGGSKGVPRKNLCKINEVSLVARASKIAVSLKWIDKVVLSTDDAEIAEEGHKYGAEVPFLRPSELAGDTAKSVDVWRHALVEAEKYYNTNYEISILLEPTSPLRKPEHIKNTVDRLVKGGYDSVLTVSETDSKYHPLKQLVIKGDRVGYYGDAGQDIVARQQLTAVYHRNGAAYAVTRKCLVEQKTTIGPNTSAVIIDEPLVNIDTLQDLKKAQFLLCR